MQITLRFSHLKIAYYVDKSEDNEHIFVSSQ